MYNLFCQVSTYEASTKWKRVFNYCQWVDLVSFWWQNNNLWLQVKEAQTYRLPNFGLEFSSRFPARLKSLLFPHVTLRLLLLFAAELDPWKMMAVWGLFDYCLEEFVELIRRIDRNPAGSDRRDRWMARKDGMTEIKQREREEKTDKQNERRESRMMWYKHTQQRQLLYAGKFTLFL